MFWRASRGGVKTDGGSVVSLSGIIIYIALKKTEVMSSAFLVGYVVLVIGLSDMIQSSMPPFMLNTFLCPMSASCCEAI